MRAKSKRPILRAGLVLIALLLAVVIAYLLYVILTYERIEDNLPLAIEGDAEHTELSVGKEYTVVTQNLGFGAYNRDFTFFMDGGKESRAKSRESVLSCTDMAMDTVGSFDPDFILFQEVDIDSTRSYHVDQYSILAERFGGYDRIKAINYDSAYLMYPILEPHGASYSSMATFSRYEINSAIRRSFPISTSFSKFLGTPFSPLPQIPYPGGFPESRAIGGDCGTYRLHLPARGTAVQWFCHHMLLGFPERQTAPHRRASETAGSSPESSLPYPQNSGRNQY